MLFQSYLFPFLIVPSTIVFIVCSSSHRLTSNFSTATTNLVLKSKRDFEAVAALPPGVL